MSNEKKNTSEDLLDRRRVLGSAYRLFYNDPFAPVKGEGVWLEDIEGRRYLDAYNNVPVVGHCNPAVVEALARQAKILNTHTRYLHQGVLTYAEHLLTYFPDELDNVMFTCTGSEANDLALRIAQQATGRSGLIVTENAYHGVTHALAEMSPSLRVVGPHVRTVPSPCQLKGSPEAVAASFAAAVDKAAVDLQKSGMPVAALMVDTVFASDGLHVESDQTLALAAEVVRRQGGLFIADEVQGGFARVGQHWWAFQRDDVVPDMVSMGKPMGNGHPIAGLVVKGHLLDVFGETCRYFNTFGGNTVSVAVGLAVLKELERIDAPAHVAKMGTLMQKGFTALSESHACISAVRGRGLYWGVDICSPTEDPIKASKITQDIVNGLRNRGVLIGTAGRDGATLKIRPPLVFQSEHVSMLMHALDEQCKVSSAAAV